MVEASKTKDSVSQNETAAQSVRRHPMAFCTSPDVAYEISTGDTYSRRDWERDQAREKRTAARRAAKKALNAAAPDMLAALVVHQDAIRYDYAWHKTNNGTTIEEIEATYPFLIEQTRTHTAKVHMLYEHAGTLSSAAIAKAEGNEAAQ